MKNIFFVILGLIIASGILFAALPSGGTTIIQPTIQTIPSDPSPINITITPSAPTSSDIVNITVRYLFESRYRHIEIYVNDEMVQECESNICSWKGGPLSYLSYFVSYKNQSNATISTSPKILIHYTGNVLGAINAPSDKDNDSVWDINDNCPDVANKNQTDSDGDGLGDACDNCKFKSNVNQTDSDLKLSCSEDASDVFSDAVNVCQTLQDGFGDACDNCPSKYNPDQNDTDKDGIGDACDNCVKKNNTDQEDIDDDGVGDACDNCEWWENPDQNDSDYRNVCPGSDKYGNPGAQQCYKEYDGIGDACDNCADNFNPSQTDSDKDSVGDLCDNCPDNKNYLQRDTDKDGIGDGCDCDDKVKGENEVGADCGGICAKACPACIPIIKSGSSSKKIDIVFVMDKDYYGDTQKFLGDVDNIIYKGYFNATEINTSSCKFNFYYYPKAGEYKEVCAAWDLPAGYDTDCSFADGTAIVFQSGKRACSSGVFSVPSKDYKTAVHESGHNIFAMADEYCCDGGYWQPDAIPYPNIYGSKANCTSMSSNASSCQNFCPETKCWPGTDSAKSICKSYYSSRGWDTTECDCEKYAQKYGLDKSLCTATTGSACADIFKNWWSVVGISASQLTVKSPNWCNWRGNGITECCKNNGNGWWKSDNDNCTMLNGKVFGNDCSARVEAKLDTLPNCAGLPIAIPNIAKEKVVVINYHGDKKGKIIAREVNLTYNEPPNRFREQGEYRVRFNSSNGSKEFYLENPLFFRLDNVSNFEQGIVEGNETNFTIVIPFEPGIRTIEIVNDSSNESVSTLDVIPYVVDFCEANANDSECIAYLDFAQGKNGTIPPTNQTNGSTIGTPPTSGSGQDGFDPKLIAGLVGIALGGAALYWWLAIKGK